MTSKEKFLAVYPMAQIWPPSTGGDVYRIVRFVGDTDYITDETPEAAWQNAAESLPAHQEQKVCPGCGDSEAGCHQAGCWKTGVMYAAEPKPTPSEQDDKGSWPLGCVQRAFVEGMKWWQFQHNGSTAFASEVDEAEAEAVNRYGKPQPDSSSITDGQTFEEWFSHWERETEGFTEYEITLCEASAQAAWNAAKGQSNGR